MRALIISLILATFTSACGTAESRIPIPELRPNILKVSSDNPASTAYNYYGLHEASDRSELKSFIGVDPVRTEWCAAFVNAVLNESGISGSESVSDVPLMARSFLEWGMSVDKNDIQAGDIVVFPRGNQGWQGHVGFFLRSVKIGEVEYYYILGGNQSNKVSVEAYRASKALGIRRNSV